LRGCTIDSSSRRAQLRKLKQAASVIINCSYDFNDELEMIRSLRSRGNYSSICSEAPRKTTKDLTMETQCPQNTSLERYFCATRAQQETHYVSATKTNRVMLFDQDIEEIKTCLDWHDSVSRTADWFTVHLYIYPTNETEAVEIAPSKGNNTTQRIMHACSIRLFDKIPYMKE
jgi:hypothetical protein